jgi:hypothetical protein
MSTNSPDDAAREMFAFAQDVTGEDARVVVILLAGKAAELQRRQRRLRVCRNKDFVFNSSIKEIEISPCYSIVLFPPPRSEQIIILVIVVHRMDILLKVRCTVPSMQSDFVIFGFCFGMRQVN